MFEEFPERRKVGQGILYIIINVDEFLVLGYHYHYFHRYQFLSLSFVVSISTIVKAFVHLGVVKNRP